MSHLSNYKNVFPITKHIVNNIQMIDYCTNKKREPL